MTPRRTCRIRQVLVLMGTLLYATSAPCEEPEVLFLKNGDRISGTNLGLSDGKLRWKLLLGEVLTLSLKRVDRIEYPPQQPPGPVKKTSAESSSSKTDEKAADSDSPTTSDNESTEKASKQTTEESSETAPDVTDSADPTDPQSDETILNFAELVEQKFDNALETVEDWTKRIEFGARFLDGNSESDFLNIAATFEKTMKNHFSQMESGGKYGKANGLPTTNRWYANGTFDFSREGKWILFATSKNEYDEFENLNYRGTLSGGIGYRFFHEDDRRLIVRLGPAVTYERFIDPFKTRTSPDLFGEIEIRWPLLDRTMFEHKTTVNPSMEDTQVFRLISDYGILLKLDEDARWNLKFGLRHEYNSRPNDNRESSDYTSSILLVYLRK